MIAERRPRKSEKRQVKDALEHLTKLTDGLAVMAFILLEVNGLSCALEFVEGLKAKEEQVATNKMQFPVGV